MDKSYRKKLAPAMGISVKRFRTALVLLLLLLAIPVEAEERRADSSARGANPDATYGRLDGDVALVGGLGATFGPGAPRGALDLRLRYLDTVGLFADYEDALGGDANPRRVISFGFEARPVFLGRWLTGKAVNRAFFDLLIDSFGLELGAFFSQPSYSSLRSRPGLQAGLGIEVPVLGQARGPWIGFHGGVRWSDGVLAGDPVVGPNDRAAYLTVTVAWHEFVLAHAVDAGDRALR
jgi:hypothetical protein